MRRVIEASLRRCEPVQVQRVYLSPGMTVHSVPVAVAPRGTPASEHGLWFGPVEPRRASHPRTGFRGGPNPQPTRLVRTGKGCPTRLPARRGRAGAMMRCVYCFRLSCATVAGERVSVRVKGGATRVRTARCPVASEPHAPILSCGPDRRVAPPSRRCRLQRIPSTRREGHKS